MFRSPMRSSSGISLVTSLLMLLMLKFLKYLNYIAIHRRYVVAYELQYNLNILRILTSATSTRK